MKSIKPEKLLEQEVRAWCIQNRITVKVFDSRATYTERGVYKTQGLPIGCPDLLGWTNHGRAVMIELKAPGAQLVPRLDQRNYLCDAASGGCFAVIVNSVEMLESYYIKWLNILDEINKRAFLLKMIPTKVIVNGKTMNLADVA